MKPEELRQQVIEKIGEATMCWNPTPTGVFDSKKAAKIANDILSLFAKYLGADHAEKSTEEST